ncbi:MAG: protein translocase subunit SecD [Candidatus Eisenbacteria bacterium]|nr:protein translocase subunit SecD [Candidatus Eisenbacteria bacterium]
MGKNRFRLLLVVVALVLSAWYVYPTIRLVTLGKEGRAAMSEEEQEALRSKALRLGLDLQGGMHLVLEVDKSKLSEEDAEDAVDRALEIISNRVDQFGVAEPSIQKQGQDRILVQLPGVQDAVQAKKLIGQTALLEFKLARSAAEFTETLRRVDDFLYTRAETQRAAAEEAGETEEEIADADSAGADSGAVEDLFADEMPEEDVVSKAPLTSKLRFFRTGEQDNAWVPVEMVLAVDSLLQVPGVKGLIPFGAAFAWGMEDVDYGGQMMRALYLLNDRPEFTGAMLANAEVQTGLDPNRPNVPGVTLTMTGEGSHIFSRVSGANVGRRLAIVLDGKVQSAPTIMDKIRHGRASITGNFDFDDAKVLKIVLRAGALPADLSFIEERTVGPSLGRDSINMGVRAALLGGLVVVFFMILYYRGAGVIANVALLLNLLFLMAVMAGLRATLTLPGIAGIILTIGMAVDANVLIFERIREELRNKKTVRAAIESGYSRAFRTIFDANLTTLITAFVLLQFGTASIKGFAVTLSVGIVSSMFTALVLTRLIFDFIVDRFSVKNLSI